MKLSRSISSFFPESRVRALSLSLFLFLARARCLSLSFFNYFALSLSLSLSRAVARACAFYLFVSFSRFPLSPPHSFSLCVPPSLSFSFPFFHLSLSHTHILTHSISAYFCVSRSLSLSFSLPYSLSPSLSTSPRLSLSSYSLSLVCLYALCES